jgi:hypothetical protein
MIDRYSFQFSGSCGKSLSDTVLYFASFAESFANAAVKVFKILNRKELRKGRKENRSGESLLTPA